MAKKRNESDLKVIEDALGEGHYTYALALSRQYVQTSPEDAEGQWLKGQSLYYLDCNAEAKVQIESTLPLLSDGFQKDAYTILARVCRDLGKFNEAEPYYSKAIHADPKNAEHYIDLSNMLLTQQRIDEAINVALKGIDAKAVPYSDMLVCLGDLYRAKGDISKAYDSFQRILLRTKDDENALTAAQDLEKAAKLAGIKLPTEPPTSPKPVSKAAIHQPGEMTANIKAEFFEKILSGEKKIEYRDSTDYWFKRLMNAGKPPFHFRIINGMSKSSPEMTIIVEKVVEDLWKRHYEIHLGKIFSTKNLKS